MMMQQPKRRSDHHPPPRSQHPTRLLQDHTRRHHMLEHLTQQHRIKKPIVKRQIPTLTHLKTHTSPNRLRLPRQILQRITNTRGLNINPHHLKPLTPQQNRRNPLTTPQIQNPFPHHLTTQPMNPPPSPLLRNRIPKLPLIHLRNPIVIHPSHPR